ncbi:MAG TPA: hypothetical protein VEO54_27175 [Thermoanaerobaculia bacterium]|nr:hypothetical protein [Thermoanaerobaculia bacterium]
MRRTGSLFLFALFFATAVHAHDMPSGELAALGRIWGIVNYAHPWMGYRDVALDEATLIAIGRVRGGSKAGVAVDEMLRSLGDDASFVAPMCFETALPAVDRSTRMLADGVVYLSATATDAHHALRTARAAVVDLRPQPGRCSAPPLANGLEPLLVRGSLPHAVHRKVRHYGYRSQQAETEFDSSFRTVDPGTIRGEATTLQKVVFIVDGRSAIPAVATALSAAGQATFVSVGDFPLHTAVDHCQMALGDGSLVTLRTSELIDEDGYSAEPAPMMTLAANAAESDVLAAALQLAKPRGGRRRGASSMSTAPLGDYEWQADATYAGADLPSPEQRILAAYRIWNVIHFFHGSRERLDDWNLNDLVWALEHATTRRDYELALAEVLAKVPDAHALVNAPSVLALHGAAAPPFELMPVEGKPVVTASASEQVKPGDELLRIDGRDVAERRTELARYASSFAAVRDLAKGTAGTTSAFTFRRPDGSQYEVSLARTAHAVANPAKAWRILDGNVAYVDVAAVQDVEALLADVAATQTMILDLRSERASAEIAKRLNTTGNSVASLTRVPVLLGGAIQYEDVADMLSPQATYAGEIFALVDERTPSGAALVLTGARLVGTAGASAQGDLSDLVVPGNISIRFTGSAIRRVDGESAIQPDYVVRPTIRGLAQGRDEVLEAALAVVPN